MVAVHPDYHQRGIGGELVRRLLARSVPPKTIVRLTSQNEHAVRMYTRLGFRLLEKEIYGGPGTILGEPTYANWSMEALWEGGGDEKSADGAEIVDDNQELE